jgi:CspA family cold shock protein
VVSLPGCPAPGGSVAGRDPLDFSSWRKRDIVVVANLTGVEWAATDYDREPKRGGYDDDQRSDDRTSGVRPNYPSPSVTRASGSVEAIVKWFNAEKGFGFVAVIGGSEAFMHLRQLEAAGHSSVPEGARVKVRIGQGQKGPEVTEVIEVDPSTARSASQRQPSVGATTECFGSVIMYNADKGFGFVGQDGGGKDVFVHATTLERGGLSGLTEGQRVRKPWRLAPSNSWTERPHPPRVRLHRPCKLCHRLCRRAWMLDDSDLACLLVPDRKSG